jgi:hypothetical protein
MRDDLESGLIQSYSDGMSVDECRAKFGTTEVPDWLKARARNEAKFLECMDAFEVEYHAKSRPRILEPETILSGPSKA